jgi:hypothetical protein
MPEHQAQGIAQIKRLALPTERLDRRQQDNDASVYSGKAERLRPPPQVQYTTTCFLGPMMGSLPKNSFLTGNAQRYRPSHLAAMRPVTCITLPGRP